MCRNNFCSTFQETPPQNLNPSEGHIYSMMLCGHWDYTVLQPKGFWTEFPAIFDTVNPSGKSNCKLCSAQLRVNMRSVWEAVQLGTFTYNTGRIFNARKGLIGSIRHESLKYQNWCWEQRKLPRESGADLLLQKDTEGRVCPNLPLNWGACWLLVHHG